MVSSPSYGKFPKKNKNIFIHQNQHTNNVSSGAYKYSPKLHQLRKENQIIIKIAIKSLKTLKIKFKQIQIPQSRPTESNRINLVSTPEQDSKSQ